MTWQTWTRPALAACALTLTLGHVSPAAASEAPTTQADYGAVETIIRERAAAHGVSGDALTNLATCESRLDPQARGDGGRSHGLMQLNDQPTGLLGHFLAQGYGSAYSAYESSDYVARVLAGEWAREGVTLRRWSCWR